MKIHRILNLGAGVQSSAIYSLMVDGEIEPADYALFSDTGEEPKWVYEQLQMLQDLNGPPIVTVSAGRLGEDLKYGRDGKGDRFASIPSHTTHKEGVRGGMTRRQCTREYKIEPIEQWIRRELLGLAPRKRMPADIRIVNLFGFSTDEPQRAVRMRVQYDKKGQAWECEFPLFDDDLQMTRLDARNYITERFGREFRSSRCVFCPMQANSHWRELKEHDPEGWQRAVDIDHALRQPGHVVNRDMTDAMYVHRHVVPLDRANLGEDQGTLFDDDGGCDQGCFL